MEVGLPWRRGSRGDGAPMEEELPRRWGSNGGGAPTEEGLSWKKGLTQKRGLTQAGISPPPELSLRIHWVFQVLRVTCSLPNPADSISVISFLITTTIQI